MISSIYEGKYMSIIFYTILSPLFSFMFRKPSFKINEAFCNIFKCLTKRTFSILESISFTFPLFLEGGAFDHLSVQLKQREGKTQGFLVMLKMLGEYCSAPCEKTCQLVNCQGREKINHYSLLTDFPSIRFWSFSFPTFSVSFCGEEVWPYSYGPCCGSKFSAVIHEYQIFFVIFI